MITKKDAIYLENRFKEIFATKEELKYELQNVKSDLMSKLDAILKELLAMREEKDIIVHRVSDHEERITALETSRS